jgi:xanthine dehydrogenase molybdopterin-binding subunit B
LWVQVGEESVVGQPQRHMAADLQVTGEAMYVDDMQLPPNALHAVMVPSTLPHARIVSIDASEALAVRSGSCITSSALRGGAWLCKPWQAAAPAHTRVQPGQILSNHACLALSKAEARHAVCLGEGGFGLWTDRRRWR